MGYKSREWLLWVDSDWERDEGVFWSSGNVCFLNLANIGMFILWKFVKLHIHDLHTFLYRYETLMKRKKKYNFEMAWAFFSKYM